MLTDKEQEEIRRKLLGLEEEPPAAAWQKIAADIKPPRKPRPFWWFVSGALLLTLSAGLYFVKFNTEQSETIVLNETEVANQPTINQTKATPEKQAQTERSIPATPETSSAQTIKEKNISNQPETESINPKETGNQSELPNETIKYKTPGKTRATGKVRLPVILENEKPKPNYNPASEKYKIGEETIAKAEEILEENQQAETISKSINHLSISELASIATGLKARKALQIPDSVSITPEADSLLKTVIVKLPDSTKTTGNKEWYVGVHVASRYAFRNFTPTATDDVYITKLSNYKKLDPNRLGYEFAINAGKQLKPQLYLEASMNLIQLREKLTYAFTDGKVDTLIKSRIGNDAYQVTPVYIENQRQLESAYTYGGLRIGLNYYFMQNSRSRLNLSVAGGANLLLKGRTKEFINGELQNTIVFPDENNPLEQTNYNLLLGAGYNTMLHPDYELTLMPNLNYFLGSTFSKREPFGLKPYTIGVSVQLKRRFMK